MMGFFAHVLVCPQTRKDRGIMKVYVASKSSNKALALEPANIIEACGTGPDPEADANSYARDYVRAEDKPAYIFEVDVKPVRGFRLYKEVTAFDVAK